METSTEIEENDILTSLGLTLDHKRVIHWYITKFSPKIEKIIITSKVNLYSFDSATNELSIGKLFLNNAIKFVKLEDDEITNVFTSQDEYNFKLIKDYLSSVLPLSLVNSSQYKVDLPNEKKIKPIKPERNLGTKLKILGLVVFEIFLFLFFVGLALSYQYIIYPNGITPELYTDYLGFFSDFRSWFAFLSMISVGKLILNVSDDL